MFVLEHNRRSAMKRRKLLKVVTLAAASGAISAPAIAQSAPALRWRLATTFPKNLDTLYGACEMFSRAVAELSDQKGASAPIKRARLPQRFHLKPAKSLALQSPPCHAGRKSYFPPGLAHSIRLLCRRYAGKTTAK
jgi:hypothetical protein